MKAEELSHCALQNAVWKILKICGLIILLLLSMSIVHNSVTTVCTRRVTPLEKNEERHHARHDAAEYNRLQELLRRPYPKAPGQRHKQPWLYTRRYSDQTVIGTHNAGMVRNESNDWIISGNQYFNVSTQLEHGVRLIQSQGHWVSKPDSNILNGEPHICHQSCAFLDGGTLTAHLQSVKDFLLAHEHEVVTLLFVNVGVPLLEWAQAYIEVGLDVMSYIPPPHLWHGKMSRGDWPTLRELTDAGKQLITFLDVGASQEAIPWILPEFDYIFETAYDNTSPTEFPCEPDRPPTWPHLPAPWMPDRLMLVNHFLYAKLFGLRYPNASYANHTNGGRFAPGELGEHAARCRGRHEKRPNFLLVDFFNEGEVWDVELGMNSFD